MPAMPASDTVPGRFLATVDAHGDVLALSDPFDDHHRSTYRQLADDVARAAAGLASLGVGAGSRVVLMMRNRAEFHVADTATLFLGATPFSVYNTASAEELAYAVSHTGATVAIVEDPAFAERFALARQQAPGLQLVELEPATARRRARGPTSWHPPRSTSPPPRAGASPTTSPPSSSRPGRPGRPRRWPSPTPTSAPPPTPSSPVPASGRSPGCG